MVQPEGGLTTTVIANCATGIVSTLAFVAELIVVICAVVGGLSVPQNAQVVVVRAPLLAPKALRQVLELVRV
jgi:hypothetical protein